MMVLLQGFMTMHDAAAASHDADAVRLPKACVSTHYHLAAAIGFLATAWAIAEFVAGSPSDAEAVGLYVFLAGQIVWAAVVGRNAEAPAMALSHAGIVLWAAAAADRGETRAIAATMAAAAYHILIDLSWYAHAVINRDSTIWTHAERLFAAHSGTLAMTHYLFAAYVALRSEDDAWAPAAC